MKTKIKRSLLSSTEAFVYIITSKGCHIISQHPSIEDAKKSAINYKSVTARAIRVRKSGVRISIHELLRKDGDCLTCRYDPLGEARRYSLCGNPDKDFVVNSTYPHLPCEGWMPKEGDVTFQDIEHSIGASPSTTQFVSKTFLREVIECRDASLEPDISPEIRKWRRLTMYFMAQSWRAFRDIEIEQGACT